MPRISSLLVILLALAACDSGAPGSDDPTGDPADSTAPATTGAAATGNGEGCQHLALRCAGDTVERCEDGVWYVVAWCPATAPCVAGACTSTGDSGGVCTPSCAGKACGGDGCGASCGTCPAGAACEDGACVGVCLPACGAAVCGSNGCGGVCGVCGAGTSCVGGACVTTGGGCEPQCGGLTCGPDGCGGSCGSCPTGHTCSNGACLPPACTPSCGGKVCGDDGCGGSCGSCPGGHTCTPAGQCESLCTPSCGGKQCGGDGCGGSCGTCPAGDTCTAAGQCESPASGACTNPADEAIIASSDVLDKATDCGIGCYGDSDPQGCSQLCVNNDTGLSWACSGCVAGVITCTIDYCLGDCLSPESPACLACQQQWCIPPFEACSGLSLEGF